MDSIKKQAMIKTATLVGFAAIIGAGTSAVIEYAGLEVIMAAFALVTVGFGIKLIYDAVVMQLSAEQTAEQMAERLAELKKTDKP